MRVRRAELYDISGLADLFDRYRQFYRQEEDIAGAEAFLLARIISGESVIYLAEDDQQTGLPVLAGFTQLYPSFSSVRMKRLWILNDLYVRPEWRRRGAASLLLDAAKDLARKTQAAGVLLETEATNKNAQALYSREHFARSDANFVYFWQTAEI